MYVIILQYFCNIYTYVAIQIYIYTHNSLIHLSINGYLNCFYLLAIVNNPAINMGVQISVQDSAFILVDIYTQKWNCQITV